MDVLFTITPANPMSNALIDVFHYLVVALIVFGIIFMWIANFLRLPRLELTSRSIKYFTFTYSLEAAWEDIERIEMFTLATIRYRRRFLRWDNWERGTVDIGRGLVASKYSFHLSKWGRLFERFGSPNYQGIPIERLFTSNIYLGDLRNDMKQYIPHVFENNPYLV